MNTYAVRLTNGMDLKESIVKFSKDNNITSGVILSSVGCLSKAVIRAAGAEKTITIEKDLEIISLNGTISDNGVHLHLCVSDEELNCFGGHIQEGCIVNTTCELVIGEINNYTFSREYDENTGYKELVVKNIN